MFGHIVPCGIADRGVTSVRAEGIGVSFDDVVEAVLRRAIEVFGRTGDIIDRQDVMTGPTHNSIGRAADGVRQGIPVEPPLLRRLRQAGVRPESGLQISERKPEWLRVPVRMGKEYLSLGKTVHDLGLATVCEEAGCPNIYECWSEGTATFMINGERCTRACGFCQVDTRHPLPLSPDEPDRVAQAVARMGLGHAVVTCVARDDLADGGAGAMAQTISAIRERAPGTRVEVLISDCRGDTVSLETIFAAHPDVLNHNIETVARLQRAVRPSAGYARSLGVLARAGAAGLVTKSGLMVGLGEREDEVISTMADLRSVGVSIITIGQYLRPSSDHLPVSRYWRPEEFERLKEIGAELGVSHVEASPLTRSSYHARDAAAAAGARGQPVLLR
jgi:lipoic acid synthetase